MAGSIQGTQKRLTIPGADGGCMIERGTFAFTTTSTTYAMPTVLQWVNEVFVTAHGTTNTSTEQVGISLGTVSASVAAADVICPHTGTISAAYILSASTENATDDTDYWSIGCVNMTATLTPVNIATAANTSKSTGGAAITADTKRSLTLGAANQLVVTAGDVMQWTFTKSASGANLTHLQAYLVITLTGTDETVVWADATTNGERATSGTLNFSRTGQNVTSGLVCSYIAFGRN